MLYIAYSIILFLATIYSYSQIDLNLTLSSNQIYQNIQQQLIFLGYFNRPLSAAIFIALLISFYFIYVLILLLIKRNKLSIQNVVLLIGLTGIILFFSYSAFSHDLFNYMFDSRIVTKYYQNPYIHTALDYPSDLWTRFMHWTHRTYPYGPVWLVLTLPFSILGLGKFVLTLLNFKLLFTLFHLGNIYLIYKILKKINAKLSLLGTAVYAFNPVVLIESLVSPHNEVMMLFFLLLAIYQLSVKNNRLLAGLSLLLSAGIKFITIILLPLFLIPVVIPSVARNLTKRFDLLLIILFLLIPPLVAQMILRELYPWYFIPIIGLGALLIKYESINILIVGFSLGALLRYIPFLYFGDYIPPVRNIQDLLFTVSGLVGIFSVIFRLTFKKSAARRISVGTKI